MKKNVLVYSQLPTDFLDKLREHFRIMTLDPKGDLQQQLSCMLPDADGMIGIGAPPGERVLEHAKKVSVIASLSPSLGHYDHEHLNRRGILLCSTAGVLTNYVADLGFGLLLGVARKIAVLNDWVKQGRWKNPVSNAQMGVDVYGKKLGIIGMGRVGAAIAQRGHFGFGMSILYYNPHRRADAEHKFAARFLEMETLLSEADFVFITAALNAKTRSMIGAFELGLMKPTGILINIAHGQIVDEAALIETLKTKKILGAGLDVYEKEPLSASELFGLDNVITVPAIGGATRSAHYNMFQCALDNLVTGMRGECPPNAVNPHIWSQNKTFEDLNW